MSDAAEPRPVAAPWQLRPHFVFSALHSIALLAQKGETERAVGLVAALGDLLHRSLETRGRDVRLEEEIALIPCYAEVEQTRLDSTLRIRTEIEDAALDALVPCFLLQPLIEDLARHTLDAGSDGRELLVRARVRGACLEIELRSQGTLENPAVGGQFGTAELRERLRAQFGVSYRLALVSDSSGACIARLRLPFVNELGVAGALVHPGG